MSKILNCGIINKIVLAIGAHYDDIEIGIGGTILKHIAKGDKVLIALTSTDEIRTGDPKKRLQEQIKALDMMSISRSNLLLFNTKMEYSDVVQELDNLNPNIIYAPYENDTHQAHRLSSKIAQSVGRKREITTIFYSSGSSIEFYPNLFSFIDITKKIKIIKCFESQIKCRALNLDKRKKIESYWASIVSDDENAYAEGLIIKKMIYEM